MITELVKPAELVSVRDRLVAELAQTLGANERQFFQSLVRNVLEFPLLDIAHLDSFQPNVEQLAKTSPNKFAEQVEALNRLLG